MTIHRVRFEILRGLFFTLFFIWFGLRWTDLDAAAVLVVVGGIVLALHLYEWIRIEKED